VLLIDRFADSFKTIRLIFRARLIGLSIARGLVMLGMYFAVYKVLCGNGEVGNGG
jgi:hypothetical protein